jgi:hypothetical protein
MGSSSSGAMTLQHVSGFYRRAANAVAALSLEARIPLEIQCRGPQPLLWFDSERLT